MNAGLEEIANRAADRLAELAAGYIGEGRNCSECGEWKVWGKFSNRKDGKNGKPLTFLIFRQKMVLLILV